MAGKDESYIIISKIILYCRERNLNKLKKYLLHAQKFCVNSPGSRKQRFEVILREKGAIEAIESLLKNLVHSFLISSSSEKKSEKDSLDTFYKTPYSDVLITSLTLLGNSFAVDHKSRENASSQGFLKTLERLVGVIQLKEESATEILKRTIKCLANLCNASSCLYTILKSKMETPDTLLDTIDKVCMKVSYPAPIPAATEDEPEPEDQQRIMDKEHYELLSTTVRALRIISSCNDTTVYRASFQKRCIATVGNVLTWRFLLRDDLKLDIVRILTSLSDKPKLISSDIFTTPLVSDPENTIPGQIVKIFSDSQKSNEKLRFATIRCLQNFSKDPHIASKLGVCGLLDAILHILETEDDKILIGHVVKLLATLVKSSENKYQLSKSSKFESTLRILKNPEFKEFHTTILTVYESVFEQSLVSLLYLGIFDVLNEILLEEGGKMDTEILSKRISSLDSDKCNKHSENGCPFEPKFRCSSPSYQQVQQEVQDYMKARETFLEPDVLREGQSSKSDIWSWTYSGSPPSSPMSSSSGFSSPRSDCGSNFYDSPSEFRSHSPVSCDSSDDEGNASLSSPTEALSTDDNNDSDGNDIAEGPLKKRLKMEHKDFEQVNQKTTNMLDVSIMSKTTEERKASAKKIVSVLGILHQYTLFKPFPADLVKVAPALLSVILSAKITIGLASSGKMEKFSNEWDSECKSLGRRSFELSFKILKTMFLSIVTFHPLVCSGSVSLLYRMFTLPKYFSKGKVEDTELKAQYAIVESDFHNYCDLLLKALTGVENETAGWREGFLLRQLIISKSKIEIENIALNIPLIYRVDNQSFKNFRHQGKCWDLIFDILSKSEGISFAELQGCILALSSLCETMGMTWSERDSRTDEPLLKKRRNSSSEDKDTQTQHEITKEQFVLLEMDDGFQINAEKEMLTNASPVFGAMFNGYFIETGQQKAKFKNVSTEAVQAFLEQIKCLQDEVDDEKGETTSTQDLTLSDNLYELSTLFDLLTLCDQYLLDTIYRRTLNTLMRFYICPNSAPVIYTHAVKRSTLLKPGENNQPDHMDLSYLILKYLLVAKDISATAKCGAFWKIFDNVTHLTVVSDLRMLIESFVFNRKLYSNSRFRKQ